MSPSERETTSAMYYTTSLNSPDAPDVLDPLPSQATRQTNPYHYINATHGPGIPARSVQFLRITPDGDNSRIIPDPTDLRLESFDDPFPDEFFLGSGTDEGGEGSDFGGEAGECCFVGWEDEFHPGRQTSFEIH